MVSGTKTALNLYRRHRRVLTRGRGHHDDHELFDHEWDELVIRFDHERGEHTVSVDCECETADPQEEEHRKAW